MNHQGAKEYLLAKPEAQLSFPFGPDVMVFKVKNKMFATLGLAKVAKAAENEQDPENTSWWMNLKCDPDEAAILRDIFPAVIPGYHMNKRLWNTIVLDGSIPQGEVERMMDNSYLLVVNNMPKKDQQSLLLHL